MISCISAFFFSWLLLLFNNIFALFMHPIPQSYFQGWKVRSTDMKMVEASPVGTQWVWLGDSLARWALGTHPLTCIWWWWRWWWWIWWQRHSAAWPWPASTWARPRTTRRRRSRSDMLLLLWNVASFYFGEEPSSQLLLHLLPWPSPFRTFHMQELRRVSVKHYCFYCSNFGNQKYARSQYLIFTFLTVFSFTCVWYRPKFEFISISIWPGRQGMNNKSNSWALQYIQNCLNCSSYERAIVSFVPGKTSRPQSNLFFVFRMNQHTDFYTFFHL